MSSSPRDPRTGADGRRPRGSGLFWLVPALTFLVGLLVGGVVIGLTGIGDDLTTGGAEQGDAGTAQQPAPTDSPGAPGSGDRTVTVPGECIEAAERSEEALALTREAAQALGDLDPRRVQEIVDRLQDLDPEIRSLAAECRDAGIDDAVDGGTPTSG